MLAAARPLSIDALEVRPQQLRRSRHREPPGSRRVIYPEVAEAEVVRPGRRVVTRQATGVRLRVTGPALPSPRATLALTDALRNAVLKTFDSVQTGRSSVQLFGKDRDGRHDDDHGHAHYLAFPSPGATRRALDTLVVWAPGGLDGPAVEALSRVRELWPPRTVGDFQPCRVAVEAVGEAADVAPELCGTGSLPAVRPDARRWRSFTPYAPPRHVRRQPSWLAHAEAYLRRDLAAAEKPPPVIVRPIVGVAGADATGPHNGRGGGGGGSSEPWLAFRRHRTKERLENARRATGFEIEFAEPVEGPLCLGALRHLGLGLFLPIADDNG
ncbi:MAG TPA: type I-U CRISPR-associated protein Csb2 [Acidimicrobiales bacterium]|nr:type I-U CRISPR-associated protein Csb2 [Acidimicrobiales bacterium]